MIEKKILNKLHFEIEINSTLEKVWDKMLGDEGYRIWTMEFNPGGSWYEKENSGEFVEGEWVKFIGPDEKGQKGGMVSKVAKIVKNEFISFEHYGYIMNGVEDTESDKIKSWAPAFENYSFQKIDDNKTLVKVDMDSDPDYTEMFSKMWPMALNKLKEICEN